MKYFLLTFDLEDSEDLFNSLDIKVDDIKKLESEGLRKIINLLDETKIKATFFITLKFFKDHKQMIKELVNKKHEIGLHAYSHEHRYDTMDEKKSEYLIGKAKKELEKGLKIKINGFRAPEMRPPSYSILKKLGFKYDSSRHPTIVTFLYSRKIKKEDIIVVPVSVTPIIKLPFSWIWFRNMGNFYNKICTRLSLINNNFINIYFHNWDFIELYKFKYKKSVINDLIVRNSGERCLGKLKEYILWIKKNNFQDKRIKDIL